MQAIEDIFFLCLFSLSAAITMVVTIFTPSAKRSFKLHLLDKSVLCFSDVLRLPSNNGYYVYHFTPFYTPLKIAV